MKGLTTGLVLAAALTFVSAPLVATAAKKNCRMGLFGGRVCSTDTPSANQSKSIKYYHKTIVRPKLNFPATMSTGGKRTFIFDPKRFAWAAYNTNGKLIRTGVASGGKSYCEDVKRACKTPVGRFSVYSKGSASCKSSKYPIPTGGAPMPYCMFFRGGYGIHGSSHVPAYNASHGCIRVKPTQAKWLSKNFIKHGTQVIVLPY